MSVVHRLAIRSVLKTIKISVKSYLLSKESMRGISCFTSILRYWRFLSFLPNLCKMHLTLKLKKKNTIRLRFFPITSLQQNFYPLLNIYFDRDLYTEINHYWNNYFNDKHVRTISSVPYRNTRRIR